MAEAGNNSGKGVHIEGAKGKEGKKKTEGNTNKEQNSIACNTCKTVLRYQESRIICCADVNYGVEFQKNSRSKEFHFGDSLMCKSKLKSLLDLCKSKLIHYQTCESLNLIHYQTCASLNLIH